MRTKSCHLVHSNRQALQGPSVPTAGALSPSRLARSTQSGSGKLCLLLLLGAACGEQATSPPSPASGGSPISGAGTAASFGGTPVAGGPAGGGAAGTAGAAGGGGAGGATPGTGGGGAGGGGAGSSGAAAAGAGAGGQASDPAQDAAAFAPLDGFQLLDPCDLTTYKVEPGGGAVCPQKDDVKNQHVTLHLAGDADVTYSVTLRVRGIVERYWYDGGTVDPVSNVFYRGGVPTVGGFASACKNKASSLPFTLPPELSPTDGCFNGFNVFGMSVSAPKQHFFLNYTTDKDGDRPPHAVYRQDYTVTLDMQGQATLDFYIIGSDEHQCYNHDQVVDGVQLPSAPYIGEFLQFNVVKVARKSAGALP